MNKEALWTKGFIQIWVSNFFLFMTFYFLLVSLPIYAIRELNGKQSTAGLIVTVFIITAILIRPVAGNLMQKIGKRAIFLTSLLIFLVASIFYLFTDSLTGLLIVRALHGIGFGMATTATGTIVADILPSSRRGEGMGYYSMSMNLAMVIGPFIGLQAINSWGTSTLFILAVIFAFFAVLTGGFMKMESEADMEKVEIERTEKKGFQFNQIIENTAVKISVVAAMFGIVYSSILSFVSVYAENKGFISVSGYFFVVYAIFMLMARPFAGKWFDRYGANKIVYPCIILFSGGMILLGLADSEWMFLLSAALIGLGYGSMFPCLQTIAIQKAAPHRRGLATATFLSIFDIGIGFGSYIVGIIGDAIGLNAFYTFSSIYILIGIAVYYYLHGKTIRKETIVTKKEQLNTGA
ncbi:MFS transporter [Niallia sp. FSL W8-0635]|uniref:MFS transporter n=1 Tax=Niallia sp. FSL W8-0635 TaxID=2975337 RepID=UPI0009CD185F|nr:Putative transporter [Mycobacteroides abscessus subsp. abscessus]HEO8419170.1 MFS transporter [Yersinia enterocolitica]